MHWEEAVPLKEEGEAVLPQLQQAEEGPTGRL